MSIYGPCETNSVQNDDDGKVSKAGDTMSGNLNMDGHAITKLSNPVRPRDATHKSYVDSIVTGQVSKQGDNMLGDLHMRGNIIRGLPIEYPPNNYQGNEAVSWRQAAGLIRDSIRPLPTREYVDVLVNE